MIFLPVPQLKQRGGITSCLGCLCKNSTSESDKIKLRTKKKVANANFSFTMIKAVYFRALTSTSYCN